VNYKQKAIGLKYPDLEYGKDYKVVNEGETGLYPEVFSWNTSKYPKPTDQEMLEWYNNQKYIEDRVSGTEEKPERYLSIAEQMDMQYWDMVNGTTNWRDHINAVKAAHPKPV
jgi:hypothetical protein